MTTPQTAQRIRLAGGDRLERLGGCLTCGICKHSYRIVQEFRPGRRRLTPGLGGMDSMPPETAIRLLRGAWSARLYPCLEGGDEVLVAERRGRSRFTIRPGAGVPSPEHERLGFHVFQQRLQISTSVPCRVLQLGAKLSTRHRITGSRLPGHFFRCQMPRDFSIFFRTGNTGCRVVLGAVAALATCDQRAFIISSANDAVIVGMAVVCLAWVIGCRISCRSRMAIKTSWVRED
jgi:hypothetical protein